MQLGFTSIASTQLLFNKSLSNAHCFQQENIISLKIPLSGAESDVSQEIKTCFATKAKHSLPVLLQRAWGDVSGGGAEFGPWFVSRRGGTE